MKAAEVTGGFVIQQNRRREPAGPAGALSSQTNFSDRPHPTSESDEVRLGFPDLMPSYHHERATVQGAAILPVSKG